MQKNLEAFFRKVFGPDFVSVVIDAERANVFFDDVITVVGKVTTTKTVLAFNLPCRNS
jgi:hypothetical protein